MINQVLLELLSFFAGFFNGNYGYAIIAVTLSIRLALLPIILPSAKSQRKMLKLQPEIKKLQKKYAKDKQTLSQKTMELYKKEKVNPLGGCLPQIAQIVLFFAFYSVLRTSLNGDSLDTQSLEFYWWTLSEPDRTFVLSALAGISQFLLGIMILPATDTTAEMKLATQTKTKKDDEEAFDASEMAKTMQTQMVFLMPMMTAYFAYQFPSGLALYWVTSTLFSLVQQYFVSGLGGIKTYLLKFGIIKQ